MARRQGVHLNARIPEELAAKLGEFQEELNQEPLRQQGLLKKVTFSEALRRAAADGLDAHDIEADVAQREADIVAREARMKEKERVLAELAEKRRRRLQQGKLARIGLKAAGSIELTPLRCQVLGAIVEKPGATRAYLESVTAVSHGTPMRRILHALAVRGLVVERRVQDGAQYTWARRGLGGRSTWWPASKDVK